MENSNLNVSIHMSKHKKIIVKNSNLLKFYTIIFICMLTFKLVLSIIKLSNSLNIFQCTTCNDMKRYALYESMRKSD